MVLPVAFVPLFIVTHSLIVVLSPIITSDPNFTRQILMDENPWTYRIMGEELANEERYEANPNPQTVEMSDVRNYVYIEYNGNSDGNNIEFGIVLSLMADCEQYVHHHNFEAFSQLYAGGIHRTSIELPQNFDTTKIYSLGFVTSGSNDYTININDIYYDELDLSRVECEEEQKWEEVVVVVQKMMQYYCCCCSDYFHHFYVLLVDFV